MGTLSLVKMKGFFTFRYQDTGSLQQHFLNLASQTAKSRILFITTIPNLTPPLL